MRADLSSYILLFQNKFIVKSIRYTIKFRKFRNWHTMITVQVIIGYYIVLY